MKSYYSKTVLIFILFMLFPSIMHAEESISPFRSIQYSRSLPHAVVDQAKESIPKLHQNYEILYEQGSSILADATYSLIVYMDDQSDDTVHIEGAVVKYQNAWLFSLNSPKEKVVKKGCIDDGANRIFKEIVNFAGIHNWVQCTSLRSQLTQRVRS